ncbi:DUF2312 domain-containing protein [Rhizobium leguminosarum]|uniref:DUF2312 domain-containing protein n=1 Tax=Rhizobium leguminosarum TaxID=384 RepID=UPI0010303BD5|nr:DUF2312 domain-containing protein [Rhizobium leguminosarum]TAV48413.1 DUF2312 domain-containing protein [Rhizobium leguminosarum]TAV57913.1 DUF2312 domain-containing protein [Rhizobium leguminosarum]TAV68853.1 DUF2312 domain-containing protein [Rhizobium leguminosarum]
MTADKQLKSYIDRVLRLKEEQDALGQDIRDVYAEAKAEGYDKTIMGKLVAHLRRELKQGAGAVAEAESIFDTYLNAYQRASGTPVATHTHEEKFDPITGEFLDEPVNAKLVATVASGMQTETGRKALIAAVDIMIAREEVGDEFQEKASGDNGATGQAAKVPADSVTGDASRPSRGGDTPAPISPSDDDAIAAVNGKAGLANVVDVEPSSSGQIDPNEDRKEDHSLDGNADASAGGRHVTAQAHRAATAGALVQVAPATKPLRPHCRNPGEHCGGYGSNHCHSCLRAAKETEVAA